MACRAACLHMEVAEAFLVSSQDAVCLRLRAHVLGLPELAQLVRVEEHVAGLQLHAHRPLEQARLREDVQADALPVPCRDALCQLACTSRLALGALPDSATLLLGHKVSLAKRLLAASQRS